MSATIDIERNGRYIELRGWIGPQTPALCKAVGGGGRFVPKTDSTDAHWRYPLDLTVCRSMRRLFGQQLRVGVELAKWSRAAIADEGALATIATDTDATLSRVPLVSPTMAKAMENRTYQKVAAVFGAKAGSFLLSDQPGLGKTIETLASIVEAKTDDEQQFHLIFCPKVAMSSVWAAEVAQWLPGTAQTFVLTGTKAQRTEELSVALNPNSRAFGDVYVIANIEMARIKPELREAKDGSMKKVFDVRNAEHPGLFEIEWDTIVVDESHRALIRTSGQPSQQRAGFNKLRARRRIALSGTPMRGKPEQLWGTLNWLRPELFGSYWAWVQRYFNLTSNGFSNYVLNGWKTGGKEQMALDLQRYSLRRTKAEVLAELPPKQYAGSYLIPGDDNSPHGVWVEMDAKQRKQYEALDREGAVSFEDGSELMADGVLAQNTRKKQFASAAGKMVGDSFEPTLPSPKFDWLVQKLDELGIRAEGESEGDAKIVVASQFTRLLKMFARELTALGISVHLLTGETKESSRQEMVTDFQSEDSRARVFLLNTKAGGVAITLDAADDLVILDETYVPDDQEQVEDRVHRTSRMHQVTIHHLRTLDTIEEEIAWITAAREDVQRYLLDGARGVEYARALYLERSKAAA